MVDTQYRFSEDSSCIQHVGTACGDISLEKNQRYDRNGQLQAMWLSKGDSTRCYRDAKTWQHCQLNGERKTVGSRTDGKTDL